jgi:adenine specific DNA methylase Mod
VNRLYFGDNLKWLSDPKEFPDASVDLVYLDPPFNSNADYNVLFREPSGTVSQAQFHAFTDTWSWADAAATYHQFIDTCPNVAVVELMEALHSFLKHSPMMAYLAMMAPRLFELHRVLKETGGLYLRCDPTASHYLRMLLDGVFGKENFRNEITWKRADTVKGNFGQGSKFFDRNTDSIFFYAKSGESVFNPIFKPYTEQYVRNFYKHVEPKTGRRYQLISMTGPGGAAKGNPQYEVMGVTRFWRYSRQKMDDLIRRGLVVQPSAGAVPRRKQYLDEGRGVPVQSMWDDVSALHSQAAERLGFPTQKPQALLERIINASSNPGDVVLDPF